MTNIIHRVGVKAPAEKVFAALSTVAGLSGWWTRDTAGESAVGGAIEFSFATPDGEKLGAFTMAVIGLIPNRQVCWRCQAGPPEWIGTEITFNLAVEDGSTIVLFNHDRWPEQSPFMAHCSTKWATFLLSLKGLVENGNGRPAPDDVKIDNWN